MSLRQIQKQLKNAGQLTEEQALAEAQEELQKATAKAKPKFSAFQMMSDEEDEEEEEDQQQDSGDEKKKAAAAGEGKKKKKKNRNKNKKKKEAAAQQEQTDIVKKVVPEQQKKGPAKNKDDDEAFLDSIIKQTQEERKLQGHPMMPLGGESVLHMDRKFFNYKKELKQLFAKSAQAYGALGLDEEEKEEKRKRGAGQLAEEYEGASKKMKRRLKMVERMQEKMRIGQGKKQLMVQPDPQWPKVDKILNMEQIKVDKKTGQKVFSFVKSPEYVSLQKEFERVQGTNDIQQLINFLHRNFYHHESLVYFADFLRIQGKFSDSFHFLERCLFAFESSWCFEFQPVLPEKTLGDQIQIQDFQPQVRLDLEKEHLNKVFCDCLVKYIDILGRKGCSRTSLEYCKFLLSISPFNDPYGALLRIDFYSLRAHEYQLYIDFVRKLPLELQPEESRSSLLILPNVLISVGLAKQYILMEKENDRLPTSASITNSLQTLLSLEDHLNTLLDSPDPETFLTAALLLYPRQVELLIKKVAQKQINSVTKKSYYTGYQAKSWNEILKHEIFNQDSDDLESDYPWVLSREERSKLSEDKQRELADDTLSKLYQIYVSRSSTLFSPDHILLWLKEVIGFLLNKIDAGELDRELLVAKFTSLTSSEQPFCFLARYRHLRTSDFTDDITTINPNELMLGAAGGPEQFGGANEEFGGAGAGGAEDNQMAQQQLQQMINQLQQPRLPGMGGGAAGLIQERQGMNEQDMLAMQEALFAQMQLDNEDIYIDEEEDEGDQQRPGASAAGGNGGAGLMNFLSNMIWGAGGNQNPPANEEEKKE